jgi:hypothetical protein
MRSARFSFTIRGFHLYLEPQFQNLALGVSEAGFGCDLVTFVSNKPPNHDRHRPLGRHSRRQSRRDRKSFKVSRMIPYNDEPLQSASPLLLNALKAGHPKPDCPLRAQHHWAA